jgi:hypothetical protein
MWNIIVNGMAVFEKQPRGLDELKYESTCPVVSRMEMRMARKSLQILRENEDDSLRYWGSQGFVES